MGAYNVYVSTDGGDYLPWLQRINDTQAVYHGQSGHTYSFYSAAIDNVGHVEIAPVVPGAQTTVPLGMDALWVGGGDDGHWSTAANWGGTPVAGHDRLRFTGLEQLQTDNDSAAGTPLSSITFDSGAGDFVLAGNSVDLGGDIVNNSANTQSISLPLVLTGNRTLNAASGDLRISGDISEIGGSFGLTKTGTGSVVLSGTNGYRGGTTVSAGKLVFANAAALPAGSNLTAEASAVVVFSSGFTGPIGAAELEAGAAGSPAPAAAAGELAADAIAVLAIEPVASTGPVSSVAVASGDTTPDGPHPLPLSRKERGDLLEPLGSVGAQGSTRPRGPVGPQGPTVPASARVNGWKSAFAAKPLLVLQTAIENQPKLPTASSRGVGNVTHSAAAVQKGIRDAALRTSNVTRGEIVPLWDLLYSSGSQQSRKRRETVAKAVDQALAACFR